MKSGDILKASIRLTAAVAVALACAPTIFAQGCALCYADAAATGPHAEAALRQGIFVLMIPPLLIFAGLFSVLYRRRNLHRECVEDVPAADHGSTVILNLS